MGAMTVSAATAAGFDLVERTARQVRELITDGRFGPGMQLAEEAVAKELQVSRNTLRESFRILMREGLLVREPNRGVFVHRPTLADVLDIYRVRRIIEEQAIRTALPHHPGVVAAREAVDAALTYRAQGQWRMVGSMNMAFHTAIIGLADSERLDTLFERLQAELRLAFVLIAEPERMHAPFVDDNVTITELLETGRPDEAADLLDAYFDRSERTVVTALNRLVPRA
ncbi:DNA-binding GntR family transcriptional regulator [Naumannella halotolerans]|uniref:DNA-binding GntR family transcriptional regulator n=2 Tax=Naumannella halotolerans TaxID=993414 RepID=A0A4V3EMY4_9ACTN|nr:DNA-binding GntR family transcriptional regulator [Naumannella halotolerans]